MLTVFYREWRVFALACAIIVITGLSSLNTIPRQEDPTITNLFAVVLTPFPGAGPERVEALVTEKIEEELRSINEIAELQSTSRRGFSVVRIELSETISAQEIETAWAEIRDALSDAAVSFPQGVPDPEFINDRTSSFTSVTSLSFKEGNSYNPVIIRRYAELLQDRLRGIPGTFRVEVFGADAEEIVVTLDPAKLTQAGLNPRDVSDAIRQADSKVRAGQLRGASNDLLLEVQGEINGLNRVRQIPLVARADGSVLRLVDVATVRKVTREPAESYAYSMGRRSVLIATQMDEELKVDSWMGWVRDEMDEFRTQLPQSMQLDMVFDQSKYTLDRLSDLSLNLAIGVGLVVVVLFFTLGWRGALIVACILPLTSLASLSVMQFVGLPIHQMSVSGLIVALGLLVDAAIVMTDDVRRRLQGEMPRLISVEQAIKRLAAPLMASTVTTVLAFMPMALLPGPAGDFVGSIAWAVIIMLIASFVLALTITPALAGWLLPKGGVEANADKWWVAGVDPKFLGRWFNNSLRLALAHRKVTLLAAVALPIVGFLAFPTLTAQFFPGVTRDQFYVDVLLEDTASIERTAAITRKADKLLRADANVKRVDWVVGDNAPSFYYNMQSSNDGLASFSRALVTTHDKYETNASINRLQAQLDGSLPSARIIVKGLFQGPPVNAPVEVRIVGPELDVLTAIGEQIRQRMMDTPLFIHSSAGLVPAEAKYQFQLDEDKVRLVGLDLGTVANFLEASLEGLTGGSLLEGSEELPVRVRFANTERQTMAAIRSIQIPLPRTDASIGYQAVPLSALGKLVPVASETAIRRYEGERVNLVQGYIPVEVLPQDAFDSFKAQLEASPIDLPAGYRIEYAGDADARSGTIGNLMTSVGLIVTLTVAAIVLTFNSFRLSLVTGAVAVLSMGMSLLSLELTGFPFGIQALIGVIGSIGVSINAAIIIMTALQADPRAVEGDADAVREIVSASSRHIVSTTTTTFGGFLPLIIAGGGFWPPFATAIAGGVLLSTVVSFYFTPPAFMAVMAWGRRKEAEPHHPTLDDVAGEADKSEPILTAAE